MALADHPFVFSIRESTTGSILFLGRMVDPTSQAARPNPNTLSEG